MSEIKNYQKQGWIYRFMITVLFVAVFALCGSGSERVHAETIASEVVVVNSKSVNVRSQPSTKSQSYGKVQQGTFLARYEARPDGWSCIDYAGVPAYIKSEFLTPYSAANTVTVPATGLTGMQPSASVGAAAGGAAIPAAAAPVSRASSGGNMVWIPRTGSKYHSRSNCSKMKNPVQVTLQEAVSMGYTPCKVCH